MGRGRGAYQRAGELQSGALLQRDAWPAPTPQFHPVANPAIKARFEAYANNLVGDPKNPIEVLFTYSGSATDMDNRIFLTTTWPTPKASGMELLIGARMDLEHEIAHMRYFHRDVNDLMRLIINRSYVLRVGNRQFQGQLAIDYLLNKHDDEKWRQHLGRFLTPEWLNKQTPDKLALLKKIVNIYADGHDEWRCKLDSPGAYEAVVAGYEMGRQHKVELWPTKPDQPLWTQLQGALLYHVLPHHYVDPKRLSPEAQAVFAQLKPFATNAVIGKSIDVLYNALLTYDKLDELELLAQIVQEMEQEQQQIQEKMAQGQLSAIPRPQKDARGSSNAQDMTLTMLVNNVPPKFQPSPSDQSQDQQQPAGQDEQGEASGQDRQDDQSGQSGQAGQAGQVGQSGQKEKAGGGGSDKGKDEAGGGAGGSDKRKDKADDQGDGAGGGGSDDGEDEAGDEGKSQGGKSGRDKNKSGKDQDADEDGDGKGGGQGDKDKGQKGQDGQSGGEDDSQERAEAAEALATLKEWAANELKVAELQNQDILKEQEKKNRFSYGAGHGPDRIVRVEPTYDTYCSYMEEVKRQAHRAQMLAEELRDLQQDDHRYSGFTERGSRIAGKRLYRAPLGDYRVFKKQEKEEGWDVEALIACDCSGSMDGYKYQLQGAAVMTQLALEELRVPHAVWGFGGAGQLCFKDFDNETGEGLGAIVRSVHGGTPMARGVEIWTHAFLERENQRGARPRDRVIFVVCDGQPGDREATAARIKEASNLGITVFGLLFGDERGGMPDQELTFLFGQNWLRIGDLDDLPMVVAQRLKDVIMSQRGEHEAQKRLT